jgi:hypothetical protein
MLDLRALAGALVGRTHLHDWRVVVGTRERDGTSQVVVHLASTDDEAQLIVAAATDLRAVAGVLPTQLVVAERSDLYELGGTPLSARLLVRESA